MTFVALNRFSGENGKTSQGRRESMRERGKKVTLESARKSEKVREREIRRERETEAHFSEYWRTK